MEKVSVGDAIREYFRRASQEEGQGAVARRMGIQRQNLNALLRGREGRVFQPQHLDAYAASRPVPGSVILREIMSLCWEMETAAAIPAPPSVARRGYTDARTARELALSESSAKRSRSEPASDAELPAAPRR